MEKLKKDWLDFFHGEGTGDTWWSRKNALWEKRDASIIRIKGDGRVFGMRRSGKDTSFHYLLHLSYLIKQKNAFHIEEQLLPYTFQLQDGEVIRHGRIDIVQSGERPEPISRMDPAGEDSPRFAYDRLEAVKYAERWWNSNNPAYRSFDVNCTNYVSQCLRAGGAPMRGAPDRNNGWWYSSDNWSYSWAVAHSMRWYLSGSSQGLKGTEVERPEQLIPGDIICYDFQGDGKWDHNTIVVGKEAYGMPLVNAHTDNSRNRYWSYEDSTAWTPDIQYKFFRIGND